VDKDCPTGTKILKHSAVAPCAAANFSPDARKIVIENAVADTLRWPWGMGTLTVSAIRDRLLTQ